MADFRMPMLGADMEAGRLLEWRVAPGDAVRRGDIVALIDTDKAEIEVEIFEDGVVEALLVAPGTKVPVGTPLARIRSGTPGVAAPPPAAPAPPAAAPPPPPPAPAPGRAAAAPAAAAPAAGEATRLRVTPLARRAAASLHVDLGTVRGTGEGGAITREDVERAAAAAPKAPAAPEAERAAERAAGMRRTIAAAMARSKREIPHYYLATTIDLSAPLRWLEAENARRGVAERILPAALLLRATAHALREAPELNGFFREGRFEPSPAIHLGVAISLRGGGLVAPALHDADRLSLDDLMARLRDLVQRARGGVLRGSEVSDPTITVTNLGDQGVEIVFPVITPPQVAIVGFGRIAERPWAEDGLLGVRPTVSASLAADHRVSDGHLGARFLAALARRLQRPEEA